MILCRFPIIEKSADSRNINYFVLFFVAREGYTAVKLKCITYKDKFYRYHFGNFNYSVLNLVKDLSKQTCKTFKFKLGGFKNTCVNVEGC